MKTQLFSVLLLFCVACYVEASESSEEVKEILSSPMGRQFIKAQLIETYKEDPLELIGGWIHSMTADHDDRNNVTVVASQNVYNPDGSIKEVRTIELFIPNLDKKSAIAELKESVNQDKDDSDEDDDGMHVSEMVGVFQQLSSLGLDIEVGAREFDSRIEKNEGVTSAFYITPDIMFAYNEGIIYINKTIEVDSKKDVEEKLKDLQQEVTNRNLPISVLKYDESHNFLSDQSAIKPELLAYIKVMEGDVPEDLRTAILHTVVKSSLEHPYNTTEVCKNMIADLEKQFPGSRFLVVADNLEGYYYQSRDIYMEVAYSFTDMDAEDAVYLIHGVLSKRE